MVNIQVPEILASHQKLTTKDISFVYYNEFKPLGRNLITFNKCAISFILSGQKELYRGAECTFIGEQEAVLIPNGNAIIAERKLNTEKYSSLVVFFPAQLGQAFIEKHLIKELGPQHLNGTAGKDAFLKFQQTLYITEYINGLIKLIKKGLPVSSALLLHKLEELFLVLMESFPTQLFQIFMSGVSDNTNRLREIVETNIIKNLTLTELAFLANRSLATFKRDFKKEYNVSPGKYIRERKLDTAQHQLKGGASVNEIYLQLGYDNVSNFAAAFKKRFGLSPTIYQSKIRN
ncbi:AraC family transcriptional regulator [Pedobacter gandavensis]|uniref:helix-turn-helix domain-containing protein n=1 Tax=Pedobacter gandavensis TaxID=2679963 RepID=UPI00247A3D13|nr:AraC family transcriptional regulator [Pedobacter gandavensis]WGQ09113.1 AraC family transcriptional regulator [Pedobacter gandavensis]